MATDIAQGLSDGGSRYLLYVLAFFCVSVVLYLIREYVSSHKTLILVLSQNNQLMKRLCRHMRRQKLTARSEARVPGPPSSTVSARKAAPSPFARLGGQSDG